MRYVAAICASMLLVCSAAAQPYPSKRLTIITPFSAGSGADIVARNIASGLNADLAQVVIVDNRSGASGDIAMQAVARAKPDGYTLVLGSTGPLTVNPTLHENAGFDSLKDFSPISLVASGPLVAVVRADSPIGNIAELVALAKQKSSGLSYGSTGTGSANHLAAELISKAANIKMVNVPYRGNSEAITDLLSGNLDLAFSGVPAVLSLAQGGQVRMLAITGPHRLSILPDIPTIGEAGYPDAEAMVWFGLLAPAGTPEPVIERLNASLARILKGPTMTGTFSTLGLEPTPSSPQTFSELIKTDSERWGGILRSLKIKPE